jgi:hypothetical protein
MISIAILLITLCMILSMVYDMRQLLANKIGQFMKIETFLELEHRMGMKS